MRRLLIVIVILLFVFAILDIILLLCHVLDAFVWYKGPGGAVEEFSNISYWVNAMKLVTYGAQTSIADGMLVRIYLSYIHHTAANRTDIQVLCRIWQKQDNPRSLGDCMDSRTW